MGATSELVEGVKVISVVQQIMLRFQQQIKMRYKLFID